MSQLQRSHSLIKTLPRPSKVKIKPFTYHLVSAIMLVCGNVCRKIARKCVTTDIIQRHSQQKQTLVMQKGKLVLQPCIHSFTENENSSYTSGKSVFCFLCYH